MKNLSRAGIQNWGCWAGSKNASSVLCSPPGTRKHRMTGPLKQNVAQTEGKEIKVGKISQHSCRPRISCDVIDFIKSRCSRNSWNRRRSEPNISGSDSPPLARRKKKDLRYDFSPFLAALGFRFLWPKTLLPKALLP